MPQVNILDILDFTQYFLPDNAAHTLHGNNPVSWNFPLTKAPGIPIACNQYFITLTHNSLYDQIHDFINPDFVMRMTANKES